MGFTGYHRNVIATVGSDSYTIPTGNLVLRNDPVTRAGSFALELINSTMVFRFDGWLVRAEFSYDQLTDGANDDIRSFVEGILDQKICVIDFDPEDEYPMEDRSITFVLESAPDAVVADFQHRARHRTSSFNLVSKSFLQTPLVWVTS